MQDEADIVLGAQRQVSGDEVNLMTLPVEVGAAPICARPSLGGVDRRWHLPAQRRTHRGRPWGSKPRGVFLDSRS